MLIKNLVLSGGQIKGLSYVGVLKAMEELELTENIKNILGVSSGAIFAFGIALGLTSTQLTKILDALTLDNLRDINSDNILGFNETFGLDSCNQFCKIFKVITKKLLGNENATFKDLKEKLPKYNLIIVGTNISKKTLDKFSYIDTPDMPIWLAVRISMSVPIYFTKVFYNGDCYVDGGILNNYPITFFDNDIEHTLGIILTDPDVEKEVNTIGAYMYKIMDCVMNVWQNYLKDKYSKNTIEIFVKYNLLEFRFDKEVKDLLIKQGYDEFKKTYNERFSDKEDKKSVSTNNESIEDKNVEDVIDFIREEINSQGNIESIENLL